jgi:predicted glycosyltransferase
VLSYLHPRVFRRDPGIRAKVGLPEGRRLVLCRLVQWTANHDYGHGGIAIESLARLLDALAQNARVVVSSEAALPEPLARYRLDVAPSLVHQVLASADLYLGESATMAAEAAVLGVPSIYVGSRRPGYVDELEGHGLLVSARDADACAAAAANALGEGSGRGERTCRLERYLADADDLVAVILGAVRAAAQPRIAGGEHAEALP